MELLEGYFRSWGLRASALKAAAGKIKLLPKEAQKTQACVVRDACLVFVSELERDFGLIASDYNRRKDQLFIHEVQAVSEARTGIQPWPYKSDSLEQIRKLKLSLAKDVVDWANESVSFETQVLGVQAIHLGVAYQVIGELALEYGIQARFGKKKS